MLVVKLELWPLGAESRKKEIGRMYIANDGGGSVERGDYQVAVCRRGTLAVPKPINPKGPKATRTGEVKNYPRLAYNVWRLISRALRSAFPEEHHGDPVPADEDPDCPRCLQRQDDYRSARELAPPVQCSWCDSTSHGPQCINRPA